MDRQMEQRTLGTGLLPRALTPGLAWPGLSLSSSLPPSCFLLLPDAGSVPFHPFCPCYCPSSPPLTSDNFGLFIYLSSFFSFLPFLSVCLNLSPSGLVPLAASPHPLLPDLFTPISLSLSLSASLGVCLSLFVCRFILFLSLIYS